LSRNRLALAGVVTLGVFVALRCWPLGRARGPAGPEIWTGRWEPLSPAHPLGTDSYGRDLLSRVIYGARISLMVALVPVLLALVAGLSPGSARGLLPGVGLNAIVMRVVDAMLSFPAILLAIAIMGVLGPSVQNVCWLSAWCIRQSSRDSSGAARFQLERRSM